MYSSLAASVSFSSYYNDNVTKRKNLKAASTAPTAIKSRLQLSAYKITHATRCFLIWCLLDLSFLNISKCRNYWLQKNGNLILLVTVTSNFITWLTWYLLCKSARKNQDVLQEIQESDITISILYNDVSKNERQRVQVPTLIYMLNTYMPSNM